MASKKKKAGGKGGKNDDWDDDSAERRLQQLDVKGTASDEDEETTPVKPKPGPKSAFNMLAALGSDEDDAKSSDDEQRSSDEEKAEKIAATKMKQKTSRGKSGEDAGEAPGQTKKPLEKPGKKGKKEKKGNQEEDDLDALLADLDKPVEKPSKKKTKELAMDQPGEGGAVRVDDRGKGPGEEAKGEDDDEEKAVGKRKKKKKKGGKEKSEEPDEALGGEETEKGGEKPGDEEEDDGGEGAGGADKKKKKKKEKKEKDGDKKESKKKKHVDLIKELLRKKQEAEEEALRQQQLEEQRREAVRLQQEEEERLAREKKEREKQKKRDREARMKKEGTYMTPAEREKKRRQEMMLANTNVVIAGLDGDGEQRKRPVYGKKKPTQKPSNTTVNNEVTSTSAVTHDVSITTATKEEESGNGEVIAWDTVDDADTPHKEEAIADDWEQVEESEMPETVGPTTQAGKIVLERESRQKTEDEENESSSSEEESSSSEESSEESSDDEEEEGTGERPTRETKEQMRERVRARIRQRREAAEAKRSVENLRAPVICVLGHVDTGKTKMLDTIRRTNVQDCEAGGITQQIGATQVPAAAIRERCKMFVGDAMKIPGFLIIDTPGHESFANLRSRGSSLCDIAILVVDMMHGLEPQTIESIKLLVKRGTPFVVALNKIDRLYNYESNPRKDIWQLIKSQPLNTQLEFKERFTKIGLNIALANANPDPEEYIDVVPTSAFLGDGIGNLMAHLVQYSERRLAQKLAFSEALDAIVMEVRALPGLGTTIDVILINGTLRVGDIIAVTGTHGAILTPIRDLLMPQPLKESRVKNVYEHFPVVRGAQGVKILAKDLENALAGLPLFVANSEDEVDVVREDCEQQLSNALMAIKKKPEGVYVQASTLGSLEALLEFLKTQKIPYSNVNIGPVHKKDVQKAAAMLEHKVDYACILAFDVKVEEAAQQFADREGVKIFQADIIYHLQDNFLQYREELRLKRRRENEHLAIFPCKLRILPQNVFNARNPIVCGVSVEAGQLKRGTPLCVPSKECLFIGTVASIQRNHDEVQLAKTGDEVCIKIENTTGEAPKLYGRHFDHTDILVSRISRETIDVCKKHFRDDLSKADWGVVVELKKLLDIF